MYGDAVAGVSLHYAASDHGRFKSVCCVPYFLITLLVLSCLIVALVLMAVFGFRPFGSTSASPPADYNVINSILITLGAVIGIVVLANVYTWMRAVVYLALPTRKQVGFAPRLCHFVITFHHCLYHHHVACPVVDVNVCTSMLQAF